MLASLLHHTNQITDVQVKSVDYLENKIVFHSLYESQKPLCPCCGHQEYSSKGSKHRKLRMAPMGNKTVILSLEIFRLRCNNCNHLWWPPLPFVQGRKRVTIFFQNYVINMMNFATIEHVAKFLGVSWGLVKGIHKSHLQKEYCTIDFESLRYIGVDEFSIRKGHEYMTIFINLESGVIIHAVEGKSIDSVRPFLQQLKEKAPHLQAMAMDMNAALRICSKKIFTGYRFHVVGLLNTVIDEIRRDQQAKCNGVGLRAIKGMRFFASE